MLFPKSLVSLNELTELSTNYKGLNNQVVCDSFKKFMSNECNDCKNQIHSYALKNPTDSSMAFK